MPQTSTDFRPIYLFICYYYCYYYYTTTTTTATTTISINQS